MTEQTQPTDAEIEQLYQEETGFSLKESPAALLDFARAVLAKWGTPAGVGEPVGYINRGMAPHTKGKVVFHEKPTENLELRWWTPDQPVFTTPQPTQAQAGAVPLTDEQCDAIYEALDAFGREVDHHEYGLPYCTSDGETLAKPEAREVIRQAAHGIKGADHA